MDPEKFLRDLIWVGCAAIYLTGLIGGIVYLAQHPRDPAGRPWASMPGDVLAFTLLLVFWPVLLFRVLLKKQGR